MKPEYSETNNTNTNTNSPNIYSKLHPHHHHHHQQHNNPFPNNFQEHDSHPTSAAASRPTTEGDGATIEVAKRPRGRPPGSKNKPKMPVVITREPEQPTMSPYILEVPNGQDIIESISRFCSANNTSLCILSGSGTVANVTLKQPCSTPGSTITFHGRFEILSISATFLAQNMNSFAVPNSFMISLAGPQGQIVGGLVAGSLVSAGTMYVVAASFNNPSYHRLPFAEDDMQHRDVGNSGDGHSPVSAGCGEGGHPPATAAEPCGMAIYSCHSPSDVIWAATPNVAARLQQPPPY